MNSKFFLSPGIEQVAFKINTEIISILALRTKPALFSINKFLGFQFDRLPVL